MSKLTTWTDHLSLVRLLLLWESHILCRRSQAQTCFQNHSKIHAFVTILCFFSDLELLLSSYDCLHQLSRWPNPTSNDEVFQLKNIPRIHLKRKCAAWWTRFANIDILKSYGNLILLQRDDRSIALFRLFWRPDALGILISTIIMKTSVLELGSSKGWKWIHELSILVFVKY